MKTAALPRPLLLLDGNNEMVKGEFIRLGAPYLFDKELDIRRKTMFSFDDEGSVYDTNQVDTDGDWVAAGQEATEISLSCGSIEGKRGEVREEKKRDKAVADDIERTLPGGSSSTSSTDLFCAWSDDRPISATVEVVSIDSFDRCPATESCGEILPHTSSYHTQARRPRSCLIVKSVEESLLSVGINHHNQSRHKKMIKGCNDDHARFNVKFLFVEVREYEQVLGDNPSVGFGPPVSIGWEYEDSTHSLISVDKYEDMRRSRETEGKRSGTMPELELSIFDRERM